MESLSSDVFSALVGRIYDCVLAPKDWPAVAADIRRHLPRSGGLEMETRLLEACGAGDGLDGLDSRIAPRADDAAYASDADLGAMLLDHVRRAAMLAKARQASKTEAALFEAAVDGWATGVLLIDQSLYFIRANRAAEAMIEAGDSVRLRRGYLELASVSAQNALRDMVRDLWSEDRSPGAGMMAFDAGDVPAVLRLAPLRRSAASHSIRDPAIAVMLISRMTAPVVPHEALASLYGLTPAETRVLKFVARGEALPDIARTLGLKLSTVKTHLLRIFDKTATNRQADLLRLANSVSLPM